MNLYLLVLVCLSAGILLQRIFDVRDRLTPAINNFAIYIALPAIILAKVPLLDLNLDAAFIIGSAFGGMALSLLLILPLGKKLSWSLETIVAAAVLTGLGNTAFLGLALIKILASDLVLGFSVIYDQAGSFIILSFVFPIVSTIKDMSQNRRHGQSSSKEGISLKAIPVLKIATKVLLFPPFISLLIALFIPIVPITERLQMPLEWLGLTLLPCAMFVVGMQMQLRMKKEFLAPSAVVLSTKMVVAPLIVFALGNAMSIQKDVFDASVLQSAMPPMITPAIFLIGLGFASRLTATILSIGTLASFVTIPTIALLLN